jgi:hypothetical protein
MGLSGTLEAAGVPTVKQIAAQNRIKEKYSKSSKLGGVDLPNLDRRIPKIKSTYTKSESIHMPSMKPRSLV